MQNAIDKLVEEFVVKVTVTARAMAMSALKGVGPAPTPTTSRPARRRLPKPGAKRTSRQIQAAAGLILEHVKKNPGERMEQIGRALKYRTSQMTLPMHQLVEQGTVRTRGEKRSRQYFPVGKAS